MESRFRVLFLILIGQFALSGCAATKNLFGFGRDEAPPPTAESPGQVIDPEVERREIKEPKIDRENFEIGAFAAEPLIGLFGSKAAYRVLMYLENYGQGYAAEIARTFGMSLSQAQNQLRKFEELGILVSRREGSARVFYFARSPVADGLRKFLRSALESLPDATVQKFYRRRRRPRRFGKRLTANRND